jgi:hypothetical protein
VLLGARLDASAAGGAARAVVSLRIAHFSIDDLLRVTTAG